MSAIVAQMGGQLDDLLLIVADTPKVVAAALDKLRREFASRLKLADPDLLSFAWVIDFPLVEWNEDENRWDAVHHPFTAPKDEDLPLMDSDPGKVRAKAYDVILNGYEAGGGSIRIHRRDVQQKLFDLLGISRETAQSQFGPCSKRLSTARPRTAASRRASTAWRCCWPTKRPSAGDGLPENAASVRPDDQQRLRRSTTSCAICTFACAPRPPPPLPTSPPPTRPARDRAERQLARATYDDRPPTNDHNTRQPLGCRVCFTKSGQILLFCPC